jgi:hypothetical protein
VAAYAFGLLFGCYGGAVWGAFCGQGCGVLHRGDGYLEPVDHFVSERG